jgi:hypothetical protein
VRAPALLLALALPAAVAAQAAPAESHAPPPHEPETRKFQLSSYEQATVEAALSATGLVEDPRPEGKTVEDVEPVRLAVIEERDPAPRFLNVFHVVSRSHVVERELLLHPGEPFRQTLADESQRNLAALPQLSLVLVVAARGSAPDRVRVVVITKDVWSLRLNWNIALSGAGLEGLTVNPSETNFLGTHQTFGLISTYLPESLSVGAQYAVPRLAGSHVSLLADAGLTFHNANGAREGSFGDLLVTSPLWSTRTEWSWGGSLAWLDEVTRRYSGVRVASFALDAATPCGAPSPLCVPDAYDTSIATGNVFVTRSFGWAVKHDVTLGFSARRSRFTLPDLSGFDPATVAAYRQSRLPVSDDRVGPYLQYATYTTDFLRVLDLETLALQEDWRLGPEAYVRLYPLLSALGSTRTSIGVSAGASYTAGLADGLARATVESITEVETAGGTVRDASVLSTLRLASPRTSLGRLVLDGVLLDRWANALNRLSFLGGDTRLRGYPSQEFVGSRLVSVSVEARARPWQILESLQIGGVLFYDAGDAFDRWQDLRFHQAVGAGVRMLFPQLDRLVFRLDVGVPLTRPLEAGVAPVAFFVTFGQAFSLYEITPRTAITR